MAIRSVEALVLRRRAFRETSWLVTFFSRDTGKFTGLLKGARDLKTRRLGSPVEVFSVNRVVYYEKRFGDIFTVSQCDLLESFWPIRAELLRVAQAMYLMEVMDLLTESRDPHPDLYDVVRDGLAQLAASRDPAWVVLVTTLRLLGECGVSPSLEWCARCGSSLRRSVSFSVQAGGVVCPSCSGQLLDALPVSAGALASAGHIIETPGDLVWRLRMPGVVLRELVSLTKQLLLQHVGRQPRSEAVLEQLTR